MTDKAEILLNELLKEAEAYETQCQKEFAIKELENIKSEIQEEIINSKGYVTYSNALMRCYEIVDKRISELKGENNG